MRKKEILLKLSKSNPKIGYIYLANHPGPGIAGACVKRMALAELIDKYIGPPVYLDFDKKGELIGIEIIP